jgi:hypothetical protein
MLDVLTSLEELLRNHKHEGQARAIARLRSLYNRDQMEFTKFLQSVDVWGGSGAVWDCAGFGADENAFRAAIIRLADKMQAANIGTERSSYIAAVFRKWQSATL